MHKLISELARLYLADGQQDTDGQPITPEVLARQVAGGPAVTARLVDAAGRTRTLVLEFGGKGGGEKHWSDLCAIANALQHELDLPAPAVSISGRSSFYLWLSLETAVPLAQARQLLQLLRSVFLPASTDILSAAPAAFLESAQLPPCLQPSGKWAAFIHPGMGASFADEPGLDMPPPLHAQLGFVEGLRSMTAAQFARALAVLQQHAGVAPVAVAAPAIIKAPPSNGGLLLQDATLEDIVQWLHARNIEPTFRHRLP
ncbi:hypothetical protein [Janthinobacterium psychrotolerans]|uniref:Uncharacterized protein n=1 Tax=Janthinobacterium psychrotolerans TaxID=1747903 RepID=A0A1A7BYX2_9BURK|nr:hypothetical protein [Janthinobacterium psychrotolerans]OBV37944.1 hypothetical protein ASR47_1004219 [Janthinobacterium psychrotolerans]